VASLILEPNILPGGQTVTGTVTLTGPVPSESFVVTLVSDDPDKASVPARLTVPAGAAGATFTLSTTRVSRAAVVRISADGGGTTVTAPLVLLPAR
jgi:hypothetical protein